jgi:SAM-dependent methyltransferase
MLARAEPARGFAGPSPWVTVILTHAASTLLCVLFASHKPGLVAAGAWPWIEGGGAAALCAMAGLQWWWLPINLAFLPAIEAMLAVQLPAAVYCAAFSLLFLINVAAWRHRVPFFLSSVEAARVVSTLLPAGTAFRFLDLGCAAGALLGRVARARPDGRFDGIELAPLSFALACWRARANPAISVNCGDFWRTDLARYDVVYAYLSPAAMPRLWAKARREMRPGSLLVSNGFEVPGVPAGRVIPLGDAMRSTLHVWQM